MNANNNEKPISRNRSIVRFPWKFWLVVASAIAAGFLLVHNLRDDSENTIGSTPGVYQGLAVAASDEKKPVMMEVEVRAAESPNDGSPVLAEQEMAQLSSPFTKKTVLELNAIVTRSLAAINSFDDVRQQLDHCGQRSVAVTLERFVELSGKAREARAEMEFASTRLKNSGETYNAAILAAMVRFVENVDDEIRKESDTLYNEPGDDKVGG